MSNPSSPTIYDFSAKDISGQEQSLSAYKGKVVLIVNVASQCGFTKQYKGLEELYQTHKDKGLVILGFPCNQFGGQEPGDEKEIQQFCELNYSVTFPLFSKVDVNGAQAHPVFQFLKSNCPGILGTEFIKWNFTKFLIDAQGKPVERFSPQTEPSELVGPVEKLLN
jgi:glutathione peroxidase